MVLLRRELGDALRETRQTQGRTLREVSSSASCSLGYLSEIERGEKEASSELLASICRALDVPLSEMLSTVADRVSLTETAEAQMTTVLTEGLATTIDTRRMPRRDAVVSAA
ncbi:transcriptional regulator [Serinicoccus sp. CNJ-927]|uniref:helix-turn-helix domain-containing protein n=1 Tax=Serinicoccus TaxID=265976 RepID=UPI000401B8A4|nr:MULTISPECIES: helix-turn-helix transcriptional regulator [Serinicoccus]OLT17190.1 transcriptional regulator [Serinicoccus sp. CUA-874]OLT45058.1 transcriptional regulator [Serinicoccus sp. CNJ-927]